MLCFFVEESIFWSKDHEAVGFDFSNKIRLWTFNRENPFSKKLFDEFSFLFVLN